MKKTLTILAVLATLTVPAFAHATVVFLTNTAATTWVVPSDFSSVNTIEVIGAGGAGGIDNSTANGGGGGGYSKVTNITLTPSATVGISIGDGAASTDGGDTYLCNSTSNCASIAGSAVQVGAKGGQHATASAGGQASDGVGTTKFSGGSGGGQNTGAAAGGGGSAAGALGDGGGGGSSLFVRGGGGGGGANNGSNGTNASSDTGASGGNNHNGTGGGATATAGTDGGGGGGGTFGVSAGAAGGDGTEWDATHGSGGGGGGGSATFGNGGAGGLYGGGGGGSGFHTSIAGAQGIIVITYTPSVGASTGPRMKFMQGIMKILRGVMIIR